MNLKNILKQLKTYESSISTVLGFIVIVVIGLLVVNYFRNLDSNGTINDLADSTDSNSIENVHTIAEGESLWTIAERYYNDGFKWTEIMEANNIDNPADIEVGQELIIPDFETNDSIAIAEETQEPVETIVPTVEATATPQPTVAADTDEVEVSTPTRNDVGGTYTVVRGDNLWDIAVAEYGDGYRWTDIAEANDLVNPGVIHAGNVLVIPA